MALSPTIEKFVLHWGEMGARWGVNRSVAQIHALLFLSDKPLNAEEISETLAVARSNVSTSLKELQGWGLVHITQTIGDRRDHFEASGDIWEMVETIVDERKRREIDPTLSLLRRCVAESEDDPDTKPETKAQIAEMLAFLERASAYYEDMRRLPRGVRQKLMTIGGRIAKLLPGDTSP